MEAMTKSFKKAFYWCSKARTPLHRRSERRKVKQALAEDIESDIPNRDSKELGNDECGTRCGLEFSELLNEWEQEEKERMSRT